MKDKIRMKRKEDRKGKIYENVGKSREKVLNMEQNRKKQGKKDKKEKKKIK